MNQQLIFISDLHLSAFHPEITQLFSRLLQHLDPSQHQLFILGDLFEFWIGDDVHLSFNDHIEFLLSQHTARGVSIFFMHGNRDFLIGHDFFNRTGVQPLQEPHHFIVSEQSFLLMHGDALCTDDRSYQRWRWLCRKKWIQRCFLSTPVSFRLRFAKQLLKKHEESFVYTYNPKYDVTLAGTQQYIAPHPVDHLIHGHTHLPNTHQHGRTTRTVLGAWGNQAKIAVFSDQKLNLLSIHDDASICLALS